MADRVRTGIILGAIMATLYSLWVLIVYVFHGAAAFTALDITFGGLVLTYYVTGIAAGALIGLLSPLARSKAGAMLVGWLGAFLVTVGISLNMFGFFTKWVPANWVICAVVALFPAVAGVNVFWTPKSTE